MILDKIEKWELPERLPARYGNDVRALQGLWAGLDRLNGQVSRIENAIGKMLHGQWVSFSLGNSPRLRWVPRELVSCAFDWYAVSVCNFLRLTWWLSREAGQHDAEKPHSYMKSVVPEVLIYRNKVAAHFARVDPLRDDNEATKIVTTLDSLVIENGLCFIGGLRMTRSGGTARETSTDYRWSLTKTHAMLAVRYPWCVRALE